MSLSLRTFGELVALAASALLGILLATLVALWSVGKPFVVTALVIVICLCLLAALGHSIYRRALSLQETARRMGLIAEMNVQVNREILLNQDIELIYRTILNYLFSIFNTATTGSVLILQNDGYFRFAASRGFTEDFVQNLHLKLEDSFLYQVTGGKMDQVSLITEKDFDRIQTVFEPGHWRYQSVISAPIYVGDRLFGMLNLDSAASGTYGAEDVDIVERFRAQIEVGLLARERYTQNIERYQVDSLTGLLTRRYFEDLFTLGLSRAIRHNEHFVIALFDVDNLKVVNDTLGHLAGDQMLLNIANAIRVSCRSSDIIGRYGGDEFIASYLLTDLESMEKSVADIRARLRSKPVPFGTAELPMSFSYGLARFPEEGTDLKALVAVADQRLYAMKSARKQG